MTWKEEKQYRKDKYMNEVYGWKLRTCGACSGSGRYDHCIKGRIPKCGACEGTGKERYPGPKSPKYNPSRD